MKTANQVLDIEKVLNSEAETAQARLAERVKMLGISDKEMTPAVTFALSALFEKIDDMNRDMSRTRENLAEIERLVDVDCLAPIPNRRAFMRRLTWALSMHERYGHPSTILYFDLNDFKQINDNYGHTAGDHAIRHISQILNNTMRESDFIGRIGGDEFAIIMYYCDETSARKRGEKIAETIKNTPFIHNGKSHTLKAAMGLYALKRGDDAETALSSADMAMYVDKRRSKAVAAEGI